MASNYNLPGYPDDLPPLIARAASQVAVRLGDRLPRSAEPIRRWLARLSGGEPLACYFLHPQAFPTLALPWWSAEAAGHALDAEFYEALTCSSISGYLAIRLIDDIMDDSAEETRQLLPMAAVLHAEFQAIYARRFPSTHRFWLDFDQHWAGAADATIADAAALDIGANEFQTIAAGKVRAGLIPLAAVAHEAGLGRMPAAWTAFFVALAEWHQMRNDFRDWRRDATQGAATYIVCEARRRCGTEVALETWMAREGLAWGLAEVDARLCQAEVAGAALRSPAAISYLEARRAEFEALRQTVSTGLGAVGRLLGVIANER